MPTIKDATNANLCRLKKLFFGANVIESISYVIRRFKFAEYIIQIIKRGKKKHKNQRQDLINFLRIERKNYGKPFPKDGSKSVSRTPADT